MDKATIKMIYPQNMIYEARIMNYKYSNLSEEEKEKEVLEFLNEISISSFLSVIKSDFKQREQKIIEMRFADHMTYAAIGEHIGLSRGRIQVIVAKILRKINHPMRVNRYLLNPPKHEDEDCEDPYIPLDKLNINTRTLNCLKRGGYNCIDDLIGVSLYDIDRIWGMGEKSIDSLLEALKEFNIGIEWVNDCKNGELFTAPIMTKENCFLTKGDN